MLSCNVEVVFDGSKFQVDSGSNTVLTFDDVLNEPGNVNWHNFDDSGPQDPWDTFNA